MKEVNVYFKSVTEYLVPVIVEDDIDLDTACDIATNTIEDGRREDYVYDDEFYLAYAVETEL